MDHLRKPPDAMSPTRTAGRLQTDLDPAPVLIPFPGTIAPEPELPPIIDKPPPEPQPHCPPGSAAAIRIDRLRAFLYEQSRMYNFATGIDSCVRITVELATFWDDYILKLGSAAKFGYLLATQSYWTAAREALLQAGIGMGNLIPPDPRAKLEASLIKLGSVVLLNLIRGDLYDKIEKHCGQGKQRLIQQAAKVAILAHEAAISPDAPYSAVVDEITKLAKACHADPKSFVPPPPAWPPGTIQTFDPKIHHWRVAVPHVQGGFGCAPCGLGAQQTQTTHTEAAITRAPEVGPDKVAPEVYESAVFGKRPRPWYRRPVPWIVIGGIAVAGATTAVILVRRRRRR